MKDLPPTEDNEGLLDPDVVFSVNTAELVLKCFDDASHGSDPRDYLQAGEVLQLVRRAMDHSGANTVVTF